MTYICRLILALALSAGLMPAALAQVPPPVPALPDTERRTTYSITGTNCACAVNFALYGDSTDYQNWVEVFLNGTRVNFNDATFGWTITSPSGSLSTLARPITNAVMTFNGVQTGTVQIVGARRPRRTSQFNEGAGVPTRNFNQVLTDLTAQNREVWDKINDVTGRGYFAPPGQTGGVVSGPFGVILGPSSVRNGNAAIWNGTSGAALADGGRPWVNVTASPYLATGNGTTDDTTAIQTAATAACGTVGIGGAATTLYFPAGFYKITTTISITCGLKIVGDGWSADSGALVQNQAISSNANLSGSIIEPTSTTFGLTFSTNQAVTIRDIAVVYLSRPTAASGIAGITIAAAGAASAPAPLAWNLATAIDRVWIYGADRDLVLSNLGSFTVANSLFQMHASNGILVTGPNLPFAGDWDIGPGNTFASGSVTNCAHILITSGGGGRISGNKLNTCGSNNVIPPFATSGIQWSPNLNVTNNSLEPIVVTDNTIEGLTYCLQFFGGNVGQNASATQVNIAANQMWCLTDVYTTATSTNGMWISGMTIASNFMTAQTQAGISTTTKNLDLNGIQNVNITGNQFALVQGAGGDTSTAISAGAQTANIFQLSNKALANVTIPATVPLAADGTGTGIEAALRVNVGTAGSPVINGGALGSPSSAGTLPAYTLGGTISGGGNQINNIIIGTTTPLAGSFTTLSSTLDGTIGGILRTGGDSRVSTQFDKTSNTTLSDITGLTATLTSGLTYGFSVNLFTTEAAAGGVKTAIAGTATATAVTFTAEYLASVGFVGYGRATTLGTVVGNSGATAVDSIVHINGTITVNAGGTLTAQAAQLTSSGTATSVLVGSNMKVWKIQ
jgi:hypothetical protein